MKPSTTDALALTLVEIQSILSHVPDAHRTYHVKWLIEKIEAVIQESLGVSISENIDSQNTITCSNAFATVVVSFKKKDRYHQ